MGKTRRLTRKKGPSGLERHKRRKKAAQRAKRKKPARVPVTHSSVSFSVEKALLKKRQALKSSIRDEPAFVDFFEKSVVAIKKGIGKKGTLRRIRELQKHFEYSLDS